jgi:hypothetical protein
MTATSPTHPEPNEARRALKSALAATRGASAKDQRRIAELLRKAASEIEAMGGTGRTRSTSNNPLN